MPVYGIIGIMAILLTLGPWLLTLLPKTEDATASGPTAHDGAVRVGLVGDQVRHAPARGPRGHRRS